MTVEPLHSLSCLALFSVFLFVWGESFFAKDALPLPGLVVFQFVAFLVFRHARSAVFRARESVLPEPAFFNPTEAVT